MHLHIDDIIRMLPVWKAEAIVLVHASRRTTIHYARERIEALAGPDASRIHLLMDHRSNRARHEKQLADAQAAQRPAATPIVDPDASPIASQVTHPVSEPQGD
jgi:hypothetical protein